MNHYELHFVTRPLTTSVEDALIDEFDVSIATHGHLTYVSILSVGEDAFGAAQAAAAALARCGVEVQRLDLDLVNAAAIAERAGVSRAAVTQWMAKSNGDAFPQEFTHVNGPLWSWAEVNEWLRRTRPSKCDSVCVPSAEAVARFNTQWADDRVLARGFALNATVEWSSAKRPREVEDAVAVFSER
jgi:predicted DNA-binding transcriptional regulator AlpA